VDGVAPAAYSPRWVKGVSVDENGNICVDVVTQPLIVIVR
jgi:hypothetical protein